MDPWYLSKRNYAALILVIVAFAKLFDIELDSQFQENLMDFLSTAGILVAGVLAAWSKYNEGKNDNKIKFGQRDDVGRGHGNH